MRQWIDIVENEDAIVLYHGTCDPNAEILLRDGWQPNMVSTGANGGQPRYLYLTTHPDDARWFAEQKGCSTVLQVSVPKSYLRVDPEDGSHDTLDDELAGHFGLPGKVVCVKPLLSKSFKLLK